jgi:DNA-binding CsgD family transcriptional regulator
VTLKHPALIDFAETAYDLGVEHEEWLSRVVESGAPFLDRGLGVVAVACQRPPQPGPVIIDQIHARLGPSDFAEHMDRLRRELDMSLLWPVSRPGLPNTLSEASNDHSPEVFRLIMDRFPFAEDGLGLNAFDPDGRGIFLISPLAKVMRLTPRQRELLQMIAAHFGAAYRLRRAVRLHAANEHDTAELPHGAEVVIDPTSFRVTDAVGSATEKSALESLREAARRVDEARGKMRTTDPLHALEMWKALVRGRWSTVDWFDVDGRRYVLGVPNEPGLDDPRGLTEREMQVVSYVYAGLTNKMIGYHLGLSQGRISGLLSSAMHKLGIHNRAQLVKRLKDFESLTDL